MAVTIREIGQLTDPQSLVSVLRDLLNDLEDQLNQRAPVYAFTNGRTPTGLQLGDIVVSGYKGNLSIGLQTQRGLLNLVASMIGALSANGFEFIGVIRTTNAAPLLTDFPTAGNFGFWFKTNAVVAYKFCVNIDGVLLKADLVVV